MFEPAWDAVRYTQRRSVTHQDAGHTEPLPEDPEGNAPALQSLLAAIVESSDDAILSKDLNGKITSWNNAATRIFGYEPEEMIGTSVLRLIPVELQGEEASFIKRLRGGERIEHYETTRMRKTGERIEVSLTISPVRDANGLIVGASKIARDISERKDIERILVQTEKIVATGRMAAMIAHEINNPLEAVVNLIYLARLSPAFSPQVRDYLKLAEQEVERVSLIARQTLGYFRENTFAVKLPVADLLDEILTVYRSKLAYNNIEVHRVFGTAEPLFMRRGELTQVFANLLANAIDAMPKGGSLTLSVIEEGVRPHAGVRIKMRDHGIGIPKLLLDKIFEPFFTTKQQEGTGIGLWISRQFVEAHRGTIDVTSNTVAPEQGTCFSIFLPYLNGLPSEVSPIPKAERN
jgi:PAS domain S-box-containing protein